MSSFRFVTATTVLKIAVVAGALSLLASCSEEKKAEAPDVVRPVKVAEIGAPDEGRKLIYSGAVKARTEMNLGFRVSGKITERLVNVGDHVSPGAVLARLDPVDYKLAWRTVIQRYGIYNPYTGRGAIKDLLPHGPHNLRDILATHILKQTGSYEQASYAIQDTPDVVQQHYGRFLPQDKAALAAKILNQVWEAA